MRRFVHLIISFIILTLTEAQRGDPSLECFCLPPNQICDPTQVVPRSAVRITEVVDTRILNTNPESLCDRNRHPCCFGVTGGSRDIDETPISNIGGCGSRQSIERRFTAGQADFGEYPWTALLVDDSDGFIGTGALISPSHVITVAHKVDHRNIFVRLGDYDLANEFDRQQYPVQTIPVADIIIHPQFNGQSLKNDLAILVLSRPAKFSSNIRTVCLPEKGQRFLGQRCFVSGWGKKGIDGDFQAILKEVDLPIVDSIACEGLLKTTKLSSHFVLDKSFICAGGEPGKDACEGDGGAPLVCIEQGRAVVVGLVSWGQSCGTRVPGVYANIENMIGFIHRFF